MNDRWCTNIKTQTPITHSDQQITQTQDCFAIFHSTHIQLKWRCVAHSSQQWENAHQMWTSTWRIACLPTHTPSISSRFSDGESTKHQKTEKKSLNRDHQDVRKKTDVKRANTKDIARLFSLSLFLSLREEKEWSLTVTFWGKKICKIIDFKLYSIHLSGDANECDFSYWNESNDRSPVRCLSGNYSRIEWSKCYKANVLCLQKNKKHLIAS